MKEKRFKKIYIEITNKCNLNCNFCNKDNRKKKSIEQEDFKQILEKLKPYTDYLYFHILGEPLLHSQINKFIELASKEFKINLTTNGYLTNNIKDNKNIRQLNISLHSFNNRYKKDINEYMNDIFKVTDKLIEYGTIINYRLWVEKNETIINILNDKYGVKIENENLKIKDNIYINYEEEFIWPNISNGYNNEFGSCKGLIDHIGILSDGTIVPCCLDSNGIINLGNIYKDNLEDILKDIRVENMIQGFKKNKKIAELCKTCNFYNLRK